MKRILFFIVFAYSSLGLIAQSPKREIRAVWLTSIYALDWPDKPYRNSNGINQQQEELIDLLDKLKAANFNTVFIQTRLRGDVIYNSKIEPVSSYIQETKNTWSKYDPLTFAISECHKRGLECHAWFVTYPLGMEKIKGKKNSSPTLKKQQDKTLLHKGEFFLDPGHPQTNAYLISLIEEIVDQYDIDGIHFDYIRYPDNSGSFPDHNTYKRYGKGQKKNEWRKENINRFVYEMYDAVKNRKPWVQVSSAVLATYNRASGVYQDPALWLKKGKHDFIVPMLYVSGEQFSLAVQEWNNKNTGRSIVPGLGVFKIDESKTRWNTGTIKEQIQHSRKHHTAGNAFFRTRFLTNNRKGILDMIKKHFYPRPALQPALSWLSTTCPAPPEKVQATPAGIYLFLSWKPAETSGETTTLYNVYRSKKLPIDMENTENLIATRVPDQMLFVPVDKKEKNGYYYAVTSYDRYHNESPLSEPVYFMPENTE